MKRLILIAAASIALAGCTNDDDKYMEGSAALKVSATIDGTTATRAKDKSWTAGDQIGVTMDDRYVNLPYVTPSGDGEFDGEVMYFKDKRVPVTMTAYYPYTGEEGTAPGYVTASTTAEWQTSARQPEIDFLFAQETGVRGDVADPNVTFNFSHCMSKLSLKFNNGAGAGGIKIEEYKVDGLILEGTFNTATGECAVDEETAPAPLTISLSGDTDGVALDPLLLFPQDASDGTVTLTITDDDGQVYACSLSFENEELSAGKNYMFTITVNKTELIINKTEITDWVPVESTASAGSINPKMVEVE